MSSHPIVHVDIPANDGKAASKFYADAFGWKINHSAEEFNYTMFDADGGPGGGFPHLTDGFEIGHVLIYIGTDDIDASLKTVESLGGKTAVPKTEIPDIGWFAIFEDPTGNNIGLYQDKNA